jgi:molybdopterin-guanine dinucleotide biosynthesis protein B
LETVHVVEIEVSSKKSEQTVPRIHIVGRRNAGKTTLVCELVRDLSDRGLCVATIKHTHHHHELDTPGKDSWKHRDAGAVGVGILSPHLMAAFVPSERSDDSTAGYAQLSEMFSDCDVLLVEGDLHSDGIKIEVWRAEVAELPYAQADASIRAVVSDVSVDVRQDVWPRSDVAMVVDRILELIDVG